MNRAGQAYRENVAAPQRVAAIIPAHNVGRVIASTVRSCRAIPGVDLIIVIDDASTDDTVRAARYAGAAVVSHTVERGRASAIETGVKVAAMRDHSDWPERLLLILSGDLGESAVEATMLVESVMSGMADCAIGTPPLGGDTPPEHSAAHNMARRMIRYLTGWESRSPLKQERCLTREAVNIAMPFEKGAGLEFALDVDVLHAGLSIVEMPCGFVHHEPDGTERDSRRSKNPLEVMLSIIKRCLTRRPLFAGTRAELSCEQAVGTPYPQPACMRDKETGVSVDHDLGGADDTNAPGAQVI
ncbi:glycosyltransferase family 2 protein [Schaalia sp. lx-100]|uniref:glycosyltransferase family 2 protein n=1 Tax=Schaalia sp. lx-100 TaxID=2899081 RepID=UPI001E30E9CB|nr:glycosyltransferase [Schaalia sp. lx-100]